MIRSILTVSLCRDRNLPNDFIQGLSTGKIPGPSFKDGLATDYVTDAVLKSAKTKRWEKVKKVKGA